MTTLLHMTLSTSLLLASAAAAAPADIPPAAELIEKATRGNTGAQLLLAVRYHWRTSLQKGIVGVFGPPLIAPERMTIGTLAKQQGYRTACIGKWHRGWDWPITKAQRPLLSPAEQPDDEAVTPTKKSKKKGGAVTIEKQLAAWPQHARCAAAE